MKTGAGSALLLLVACLSGCAADEDRAEPPPAEATSEATPAMSLAETCPEIEAGLPNSGFPRAEEWATFADELDALAEGGDTEAQNALNLLVPAVDDLAGDPTGTNLLDARAELRSALDTIAGRCATVGSSALQ